MVQSAVIFGFAARTVSRFDSGWFGFHSQAVWFAGTPPSAKVAQNLRIRGLRFGLGSGLGLVIGLGSLFCLERARRSFEIFPRRSGSNLVKRGSRAKRAWAISQISLGSHLGSGWGLTGVSLGVSAASVATSRADRRSTCDSPDTQVESVHRCSSSSSSPPRSRWNEFAMTYLATAVPVARPSLHECRK